MEGDFVGSGWSFPVGVSASGGIAVARGEAKVEQAMTIVLSTYPGERPFRPEFGCRLRDYVFAGASPDVLGAIAREVRLALRRWEPRATVSEVVVEPSPDDESLLLIDIGYSLRGDNDPRNLVFPFYSIPE
ncbi:GPW/gp25 family protein [Amycolatopsis sp. SID8362]|uniref:GPW/gp25 family protein n=1 Tax=Amycolatopsis sp. SID8362 TaxID=2690346 RepID=UPI00136E4FE5|nr:GPW/gp25 family protein [Amycolatopsis sp. SID8362]NBH06060.1 baseplate protein [Amycolatopsis sp. SID8362]NED42759.1 GPW/gp25 family protein [Amycolatopsis sp. SID8362]